MANISFKSITFPGLANKYQVPEISNDLMTQGKAADSKATGDALSALEDLMDDEVSAINESLQDVSDITGINSDISTGIEFTNGRVVNANTGGSNANADMAYSNYISCDGYDTIEITMPITPSSVTYGLAFYTSAAQSTYISGVTCNADSSLSNYGTETRIIQIPDTAKYFKTTWFASSGATFTCALKKEGAYVSVTSAMIESAIAKIDIVRSGNVLDAINLLPETGINRYGVTSADTSYATTDYIPVTSGDVIVCGFKVDTVLTMTRVVTYDKDKMVISGTTTNVNSFTVPAGVYYVRISASNTYMTRWDTRINLGGTLVQYEDYYSRDISSIAQKNGTNIFNLLHYPLSSLPDYIIKNLAHKPLGQLSKGYACIITDDGDAEVATYTIPMCISKDVPATFAMMSNSDVFQTQSNLETVLDAVNNNGFCIAQHGTPLWTTYDEYGLTHYFDTQKLYWDSIGVTPYGAVCPQHANNDIVRAVAGSRFGCCRTGYNYGGIYYGAYMNGPRSNLYALSCQNVVDGTLNDWKNKCDSALSNHYLIFIYTHEFDLDADGKTKFEAIIDYAKQIGLTFITMKDIPTIV